MTTALPQGTTFTGRYLLSSTKHLQQQEQQQQEQQQQERLWSTPKYLTCSANCSVTAVIPPALLMPYLGLGSGLLICHHLPLHMNGCQAQLEWAGVADMSFCHRCDVIGCTLSNLFADHSHVSHTSKPMICQYHPQWALLPVHALLMSHPGPRQMSQPGVTQAADQHQAV